MILTNVAENYNQVDDKTIIVSLKGKYRNFYNLCTNLRCISSVYYVLTPYDWEKKNNFMYYIMGNLNKKFQQQQVC